MYQMIVFICCALSVTVSVNDSIAKNESDTFRRTTITTAIFKKKPEDEENSKKTTVYNHSEKSNVNNHRGKLEIQAESSTVKHDYQKTATFKAKYRQSTVNERDKPVHILYRIHATVTRSKDAIWATITLTFLCVLLVISVAHSRMWKDYYGFEPQGIPLPNFNERVLFKDVMRHKIATLKELFKKKRKEKQWTELETLLPPSELEQ